MCVMIESYPSVEVMAALRFARLMTALALIMALLCAAACGSDAVLAREEGQDCAVTAALTVRGPQVTVALGFENRRADERLTFVIRDIALNGECAGYTAAYEAAPLQAVDVSAGFQRADFTPVTVCDVGVAVLDAAGKRIAEKTLTIYPFGEGSARRPVLADLPEGLVALDHEAASLVILPGDEKAPDSRILCLINKSDRLMRLRVAPVYADGRLTDLSVTLQALPGTRQYAALALPAEADRLDLTLTGYTADGGDKPLCAEAYAYSRSRPQPAPTLVPSVTPRPQIGVVTIRKSGAVNVREGDSTDARKVGSAQAGRTYPCFGVSDAGWYLIRLEDGTEGYVTNTLTTFQRQ